MKTMKKLFFLIVPLLLAGQLMAQPIREHDIVYRKQIVREINLRDPHNKIVFGDKAVLSRILIEASLSGKYTAWHPDTLERAMTPEELQKRLQYTIEDSDTVWREEYLKEDLFLIELHEELIFDRNRSEFRFIPMFITVFLPATISNRGLMEGIASWKYDDCQKIFRNDSRAFSQKKKFGESEINYNESLVLRNYHSEIVKIGNTEDLYFDQMSLDPQQAYMIREQAMNEIMEMMYEVNHPK